MDFATQAYRQTSRFEPIVNSLLDTDFYKLLMLQFIWKTHPSVRVTFSLKNRTSRVLLADAVDLDALRAQLDHMRSLRFRPEELIWLRGQTFYGQRGLFEEGFLDFLRTLALPAYALEPEVVDGVPTGQIALTFSGGWAETTLWEIPALAIVNELRTQRLLATLSLDELDLTYAKAKVKLHTKLDRLATCEGLQLTDFGTRRRHSFAWQQYCVRQARTVLGERFTGTSNALLAMTEGVEARGTNAHELPMVFAALAASDEELKQSQYVLMDEWRRVYRGSLLVFLPDTFGTTQFLEGLDPIAAMTWTGARPDSKPSLEAGHELVSFWKRTDAAHLQEKLLLFSDGLDVAIPGFTAQGADIPTLLSTFKDTCRVGFGWGTLFTNDFIGCAPGGEDFLGPLSLVCKVTSANGRPCVKLSDNYSKASGPAEEVARYRRVFGSDGMMNLPPRV